MTEKDTILINIMYTGDYTNKNIGHEIINLYKTDEGENYIYISPYGKLADDKYGRVSTVLLARPAEKGQLEIIAKADDLTPLSSTNINNENNEEYKKYLKKNKYSDDDALKYYYIGQISNNKILSDEDIKKYEEKSIDIDVLRGKFIECCLPKDQQNRKEFLFKEICRDKGINEEIIKIDRSDEFENALKLEYYYKKLIGKGYKEISDTFIYRNCNKILSPQQIKHLQYGFVYKQIEENGYNISDKSSRKDIDDIRKQYLANITDNININTILEKYESQYKINNDNDIKLGRGRNKKSISLEKLLKLKNEITDNGIEPGEYITDYENTAVPNRWKKDIFIHKYHSELIKEKKIQYGGIDLDEIFTNNKYNDTTVHFTFKADKVKKRNLEYPIYIEYEKESNNDTDSNNNEITVTIEKVKNKTNTYKIKGKQLRNMSCKCYLEKDSIDITQSGYYKQ